MPIEARLIEAAREALGSSKVFSKLELLSGIKSDSWQKVAAGKQRATSEMIEWACQEWPQFTYWIASGVKPTEEEQHTTPEEERLRKLEIDVNELLSKEPVNWSEDECSIVDLWLEDVQSPLHKAMSTYALEIYMRARDEKALLKRVVTNMRKEIKDLKQALDEPEIRAALLKKHKGPGTEKMTLEELAAWGEDKLEEAVKEVESYLDKKIG